MMTPAHWRSIRRDGCPGTISDPVAGGLERGFRLGARREYLCPDQLTINVSVTLWKLYTLTLSLLSPLSSLGIS